MPPGGPWGGDEELYKSLREALATQGVGEAGLLAFPYPLRGLHIRRQALGVVSSTWRLTTCAAFRWC